MNFFIAVFFVSLGIQLEPTEFGGQWQVAVALMLFALLMMLATSTSEPRPGPWPPQGYACLRAETPIAIDGRLDDQAWAAAAWTDFFVDIEAVLEEKPRYRTRAKMLWDDQYLYVAHVCQDAWITARCRELIRMLFYEHPPRPYVEVAKFLGVATSSIGFIRGRCLSKLERALEELGF